MGVNLPAHLVIVKSTQLYGGGTFREYSETDILQMIGRAGRPQFDTEATAIIMTKMSEKDKYENLLMGSQLLESSFHKNLIEHLNAEIVLNTITSLPVALEWLKSTFLYIRVMKNPSYYGFSKTLSRQDIENKLQDICVMQLKELAKEEIITMSGDMKEILSTDTGRVMARYCISYMTMKKLGNTENFESLSDLIKLIASCSEFSDIQLRVSDRKILNDYNKNKQKVTIRYPMDGKIKNPEMKVNCLIQAQLGCLPIQDFSLAQEVTKIFRTGRRITRCLVEMVLKRSNCSQLQAALLMDKCLHAQLWEQSKHVARQLNGIGVTLANSMVNAGLSTFTKIAATNPREIELIVNRHPPFGNTVQKAVGGLPKYELSVEQSEPYKNEGATIELAVRLANQGVIEETPTAGQRHCSVIIVANQENRIIFQTKLFDSTLAKVDMWTKTIKMERCELGPDLNIHLISQSWVGVDINTTFKVFYLLGSRSFRNVPPEEDIAALSVAVSIKPGHVPCSHKCAHRATCAHKCCKEGVKSKTSLLSQTERVNQPKITTMAAENHRKLGDLKNLAQFQYKRQQNSYTPHVPFTEPPETQPSQRDRAYQPLLNSGDSFGEFSMWEGDSPREEMNPTPKPFDDSGYTTKEDDSVLSRSNAVRPPSSIWSHGETLTLRPPNLYAAAAVRPRIDGDVLMHRPIQRIRSSTTLPPLGEGTPSLDDFQSNLQVPNSATARATPSALDEFKIPTSTAPRSKLPLKDVSNTRQIPIGSSVTPLPHGAWTREREDQRDGAESYQEKKSLASNALSPQQPFSGSSAMGLSGGSHTKNRAIPENLTHCERQRCVVDDEIIQLEGGSPTGTQYCNVLDHQSPIYSIGGTSDDDVVVLDDNEEDNDTGNAHLGAGSGMLDYSFSRESDALSLDSSSNCSGNETHPSSVLQVFDTCQPIAENDTSSRTRFDTIKPAFTGKSAETDRITFRDNIIKEISAGGEDTLLESPLLFSFSPISPSKNPLLNSEDGFQASTNCFVGTAFQEPVHFNQQSANVKAGVPSPSYDASISGKGGTFEQTRVNEYQNDKMAACTPTRGDQLYRSSLAYRQGLDSSMCDPQKSLSTMQTLHTDVTTETSRGNGMHCEGLNTSKNSGNSLGLSHQFKTCHANSVFSGQSASVTSDAATLLRSRDAEGLSGSKSNSSDFLKANLVSSDLSGGHRLKGVCSSTQLATNRLIRKQPAISNPEQHSKTNILPSANVVFSQTFYADSDSHATLIEHQLDSAVSFEPQNQEEQTTGNLPKFSASAHLNDGSKSTSGGTLDLNESRLAGENHNERQVSSGNLQKNKENVFNSSFDIYNITLPKASLRAHEPLPYAATKKPLVQPTSSTTRTKSFHNPTPTKTKTPQFSTPTLPKGQTSVLSSPACFSGLDFFMGLRKQTTSTPYNSHPSSARSPFSQGNETNHTLLNRSGYRPSQGSGPPQSYRSSQKPPSVRPAAIVTPMGPAAQPSYSYGHGAGGDSSNVKHFLAAAPSVLPRKGILNHSHYAINSSSRDSQTDPSLTASRMAKTHCNSSTVDRERFYDIPFSRLSGSES